MNIAVLYLMKPSYPLPEDVCERTIEEGVSDECFSYFVSIFSGVRKRAIISRRVPLWSIMERARYKSTKIIGLPAKKVEQSFFNAEPSLTHHRKIYLTFGTTDVRWTPLDGKVSESSNCPNFFHRDYLIERNKADFSPLFPFPLPSSPTFPPFIRAILSFIELNVFKRETNRMNRAEKRTQPVMR